MHASGKMATSSKCLDVVVVGSCMIDLVRLVSELLLAPMSLSSSLSVMWSTCPSLGRPFMATPLHRGLEGKVLTSV